MQVIPALDLLGNDAVRLERGDFERVLFRQPIEEFMVRIVATAPPLIHIVDLQGARDGTLRSEVIQRCAAVAGGIPLQVSGGIRSIDAARAALDAGAARVIVGTAVWEDDEALALFASTLGDQLLVALDVADGRVAIRGWTASSGHSVDDALQRCKDAGVVRLHVTAIDRDGTMNGPDLALYRQACSSGIAVVAAGGIRDDGDVQSLADTGCEAAVMGLGYLTRLGLDLER
jgi:phosphoribosylformimino-5-aminoimidazole carboxamide ribotide isomerase